MQSEVESSVYHSSRTITTITTSYMTLDQGDAVWGGYVETRAAHVPRAKVSAGYGAARLVEEGGLPLKVCMRVPLAALPPALIKWYQNVKDRSRKA